MPRYEFECNECKKVYDDFTKYDETDVYPDTSCPHCGSDKKLKLLSQTAPLPNKNSHDYRFHVKHNDAQDQRRAAEAAQGKAPYNPIDDIGGGQYFGEVE